MANKVTIDVEARFVDNVTDESGAASKSLGDLGKEAQKSQKEIDKLSKKKAKPIFDADNSRLLKKLREAETKASKLGKTKTSMVLKAIDKATTTIGKVLNKGQKFAGKVWSAVLKVKDSQAVSAIKSLAAQGKSIAGKTWTAAVKIKDMATTPLQKIKNSLFSIKTLVATVTAGFAANAAIAKPVALADQIESSRIAFESKLGSASAAESFLQEIYKFDEKSPFDTIKIVGITQQMMNLGWTAENVLDDLGTIGDWAASLGKGEEGINSVTRALGQIRMKGKLSAEEMLQLTEAGVNGWQYLADYMGMSIAQVREKAEDGAIDVNKAITAILAGMTEFSGAAAATSDRTVSGLTDQISSLFKTYAFLPWGEGLSDGFKDALTEVRDVVDENKDSLKAFGAELKVIGKEISTWAADKVKKAVKTFKEITESTEFKTSDIGGKFKMIWDGILGNPFSEWWENTVVPWWGGVAVPWISEKAGKLGTTIGTGLSNGLLTLLGVDVVGIAEDGADIASSFVQGFMDGFDGQAVTDAFVDAISNVWNALPWWAKGLIGGYGLSKVGTVINAGKAVYGAGSTLFGAGKSLLAPIIGSTGNAMVGGSGLLGKLADIGYNTVGSGAGAYFGQGLSGGKAALLGLKTLAPTLATYGGLATAGVTAISGIKDIYNGAKNEDSVATESGAWKFGGAAGGAALGAAIGSVIPGVGTLLGAGIGGLAGSAIGWWGSNKAKEDAAKAAAENTDELEKLANSESAAAEEAAKLLAEMKKLGREDLAERFGDIALSAAEMEQAVKDIIGQDLIDKASAASDAIAQMDSSLKSFDSTNASLKKSLWLTTLKKGAKLSADEINSLKTSTKEYGTAAKTYLQDAQYASSESITALMGNTEEAKKVIEKSTEYYDTQGKELAAKTTELNDAMTKALSDGVISLDEEKSLQEIRSQIASITAKLQEDEYEADLNIIKGKYGGVTDIDEQSFDDMMGELNSTATEMAEGFWEQFGAASRGLEEGSAEWNSLLQSTMDNITETWLNSGSLGLDKIQTKWKEDLGFLGGDLATVLEENTSGAILYASKALDDKTRAGLAAMIEKMAPTTAEIQALADKYEEMGLEIPEALSSYLDTVEFYEALSKGPEAVEEFLNNSTIQAAPTIEWELNETNLANNVNLEKMFSVKANAEVEWQYDKFEDKWISPDGQYHFTTQAMLNAGWTYNNFEKEWISPDGQYSFKTQGLVNVGWEYNPFTKSWIAPNASYSFQTTANVDVKYNILKGSTAGALLAAKVGLDGEGYRGGIFGGTSAQSAFARGGRPADGMLKGSTRFIRVNEESPEMIIPLSSQRRKRGLNLWKKTGELLNVPGFARGGRTNGNDEGIRFNNYSTESANGGQEVLVEVGGITVAITVNADGTANIAEAIKAQANEIAETVAGVLADAFTAQFENTPTRGGVA